MNQTITPLMQAIESPARRLALETSGTLVVPNVNETQTAYVLELGDFLLVVRYSEGRPERYRWSDSWAVISFNERSSLKDVVAVRRWLGRLHKPRHIHEGIMRALEQAGARPFMLDTGDQQSIFAFEPACEVEDGRIPIVYQDDEYHEGIKLPAVYEARKRKVIIAKNLCTNSDIVCETMLHILQHICEVEARGRENGASSYAGLGR